MMMMMKKIVDDDISVFVLIAILILLLLSRENIGKHSPLHRCRPSVRARMKNKNLMTVKRGALKRFFFFFAHCSRSVLFNGSSHVPRFLFLSSVIHLRLHNSFNEQLTENSQSFEQFNTDNVITLYKRQLTG